MRRFSILLLLIIFLYVVPIVSKGALAAYLKFDKTTDTVQSGQTFQTQVMLDAGSDQITSTDIYILYDSTLFEAQSVTPGTYFTTVTNNITSGKIYIVGMVDDPAVPKTGSGTVATVVFKALKNDTGSLTFDCRGDVAGTSKILKNDGNATNIIVCTENGKLTVSVGSGYLTTPNPTSSSTLPTSGVFDNLLKYAVSGTILLFLGMAVRLIL
jgi:hypothetical protein